MAKDILLDDNYDLLVQDGDFVVGESEAQEMALILMSSPGEWKASPLTGFGWIRRIKGEFIVEDLQKELKTQLDLDGFTNVKVKFGLDGNIQTLQGDRPI